ncbi:putative glucan endo-1,3-beta-glucosidase GVI [Tripterygium wilfordii]|uniref:putative glucan endo-1,3-beta-glucosidase GVI n=1 Tax=Tripterygium wilfordii TaxID=458696 RepID=UPI0018F8171B|nr:putative glucan endo-1,3-beta-glucosidase GVI [Tripterygium wilfordii]
MTTSQQHSAQGIGVNYGLNGDNLPTPDKVVALLQSRNIEKVRLFDPNPGALKALGGSNIEVVLGVRNEDLQQLAQDSSFATQWVSTNVLPYVPAVKLRYVTAGNEVIPGPMAQYVLAAMQNLNNALKAANVAVPVSTVTHFKIIGKSFPPSSGAFADDSASILAPIVQFLASTHSPFFVNVYPYFAIDGDPSNIPLSYALGNSTTVVVTDGSSQYKTLFEAMIDTVYAALANVGGQNLNVVVSETGWPSGGGGSLATVDNAKTYVNDVVASSSSGTPKRANAVETYLFAIFNEDLKAAGTEQNFGLYHPDMTEVYHVNFP